MYKRHIFETTMIEQSPTIFCSFKKAYPVARSFFPNCSGEANIAVNKIEERHHDLSTMIKTRDR
jgi:hypothetical protein